MTNRASESDSVSARRMRSRLHESSLRLSWLRRLLLLGAPADVADPSASMFQRIRRSMTLLYAAVLAITLVLAGTVLYLAVAQSVKVAILDPAHHTLDVEFSNLSNDWARNAASAPQSGVSACPLGGPDSARFIFACYDTHGALIQSSTQATFIADYYGLSFTGGSLARAALNDPSGCANDVATGEYGDVMRQACVVRDPVSGQALGVIQVGAEIGQTLEQLRALLVLLLIVGGVTLLISAIGGFVLSKRALAPARLAYERQQRFIGDVSHELRTPLTLLRADAEILLRGRDNLPADDAELLDDMVDETARLATLTTNLLTLARLDSAARLPERETLDLGEVAAHVARRTAAFASERQVTVRATAQPGLLVNGVRDLIDQAALILVDNAIKYNKPGGEVQVRAEQRGQRVALIVSDTGPGVAPEHLERLGERFYRPDKARTRQSGQDGGAGLGISIARSIAALHQGTLTFASAPGQGLTATLELPVARVRHEAPPDKRPDVDASETQEPQDAARR
ncbi:MAG TPA: ATP-binding protein [Ktedonobacterales bacterium]